MRICRLFLANLCHSGAKENPLKFPRQHRTSLIRIGLFKTPQAQTVGGKGRLIVNLHHNCHSDRGVAKAIAHVLVCLLIVFISSLSVAFALVLALIVSYTGDCISRVRTGDR